MHVVSMDEVSNWFRAWFAMATSLFKSRKEMATRAGDLFGAEVHEWLEAAEDENTVDSLLLEASDLYKSSQNSAHDPAPMSVPTSHSHFAPPKTDEEVEQVRDSRIPDKTQQDTKFCVSVWKAWRAEQQIQKQQKWNNWLSRFPLQVRKKNGQESPENHIETAAWSVSLSRLFRT